MSTAFIKRNFLQRILGLPATPKPKNPDCWQISGDELTIDLERAPELQRNDGTVRLEGKGLPKRVLVVAGQDGNYYAFHNRCTHVGHRRLDPVPGASSLQCCSVGKSTYDLKGNVLQGPAPEPIQVLAAEIENGRLKIRIA